MLRSVVQFYFISFCGGEGEGQVGAQCESGALFGTWERKSQELSSTEGQRQRTRKITSHRSPFGSDAPKRLEIYTKTNQEAFTVELKFVLVVEVTSDLCSGSLMQRFKGLVTSWQMGSDRKWDHSERLVLSWDPRWRNIHLQSLQQTMTASCETRVSTNTCPPIAKY